MEYNNDSNNINELIDDLSDAVAQAKSIELLKGMIELPTSDDNVKTRMEFYTIKANGESGMSRNSLAKMCGVSGQTLSALENTLAKKAPSYYLKPYVNQGFTLAKSDQVIFTVEGKKVGNLTLYKSDYCAAVITHYAMKGNQIALHYLGNFCAFGITKWIHGITGWCNAQQS